MPILESWKEISSYLKRSIKTCQRWEIEFGLPIHRLDGTPSARVFAYSEELDAWRTEKLGSAQKRAKIPFFTLIKKKRIILPAAGIGLSVAIAALIWQLFLVPPISFPSTTPCIIFLPLENPAGDEILETWRTDLSHLIALDLAQSRVVGAYYPGALFRDLSDRRLWDKPNYSAEDIRKISEELGCNYLVTGSLIRSGEDIILNLFLHDPRTSQVIHPFRMSCQGERRIFALVDKLTLQIKNSLNIPSRLISHDIDDDVSKITTDSPEAFRLYCEGDRLAWLDDKVNEASLFFRKAIEIDPEFGEAYCALYRSCFPILDKDERIRIGTRAIELSDRINIWSRYNFQGSFYWNIQKNPTKAITAYEKMLTLMNDTIAGERLARIYASLEEYDKTISLLEKIRMLVKFNENYIRPLAINYWRTGADDKVEEILDQYLSPDSGASPEFLFFGATYAASKNDFDRAFAFVDRLWSEFPNSLNYIRYSKGLVFLAQDDFVSAEREFRAILERCDKQEKINGYTSLMGLFLTQGKVEEAKNQAQLAIEWAKNQDNRLWRKRSLYYFALLNRLSGNLTEALQNAEEACSDYDEIGILSLPWLHLRALLTLELGQTEEFEKHVAEIKNFIELSQYPKMMRLYYHLLGQRELKINNIDGSIEYFLKASNQIQSPYGPAHDIDSAQYFYSLADVYFLAGRCWDALNIYKKILPYWEQRTCSGHIYALSYLKIGKIYDQCRRPPETGKDELITNKVLALKNYRKFLSLWSAADPIFVAEVEDAKSCLKTIETE